MHLKHSRKKTLSNFSATSKTLMSLNKTSQKDTPHHIQSQSKMEQNVGKVSAGKHFTTRYAEHKDSIVLKTGMVYKESVKVGIRVKGLQLEREKRTYRNLRNTVLSVSDFWDSRDD